MNTLETIAKVAQGTRNVTAYMMYDVYDVKLSLCTMIGCPLISALICLFSKSALPFIALFVVKSDLRRRGNNILLVGFFIILHRSNTILA